MQSRTLLLSLSQIIVDDHYQPRVDGLDIDHVRDLQAAVEHWPPPKVSLEGNKYRLIDGFHRVAAAKALGLTSILVEVVDVSPGDDLYVLAFQCNSKHGLPLTLTDRRAFTSRVLKAHPDWSDREIARGSGLAQATVAKVRQELEHQTTIPVASTRLGRDGRTYATPKRSAASSPSVSATIGEVIGDLFSPAERRTQRKFVRYLEHLVEVLEQQDDLWRFETFDQAAQTCNAILGTERAKELGQHLGWSAGNIFHIALGLGYREEGES